MPDLVYISLAVGGLGLIMSLVALISVRRVRREALAPRVSSKLGWAAVEGVPMGTMRLDIWNAGRAPITVKKAQLLWKDDSDGQGIGSMGFSPYDPSTASLKQTVSDRSLQPCESAHFILPPLPPSMMRAPAEASEDKVWISVQGTSSELLRIEGKMMKPLLAKYLVEPGK